MTSETANPLSIIESVLRNEAWSSSERALFTALEKLQALAAKTTELNAIPFLEKLAGKTMAELVPAVFRYLGELPKIKDDAAAVQELLKIADKCAADKSARSAAQAEGTARVVAANMPQESIEHEAAGYAQAAAASARNALACLSDMDIPIDFVAKVRLCRASQCNRRQIANRPVLLSSIVRLSIII